MSTEAALKDILRKVREEFDVTVCAVISKNGIPLAWDIPNPHNIETFATLSATILGAAEVVYSGLGIKTTQKVFIESDEANFVAKSITPKAILVIVGKQERERLNEALTSATARIQEVLSHGR